MDLDYILTGKPKQSSSGGLDLDYIARGSATPTPDDNRPSLDRSGINAKPVSFHEDQGVIGRTVSKLLDKFKTSFKTPETVPFNPDLRLTPKTELNLAQPQIKPQFSAKDFVEGLPKAFVEPVETEIPFSNGKTVKLPRFVEAAIKSPVDFFHGVMRSGGMVGLSILNEKELKPSKANEFFFGKAPLLSVDEAVKKTKTDLEALGLPTNVSDSLAMPLVAGSIIMDFTPFGGEKKILQGIIPEDVLKYWARETSADVIKNSIKSFKLPDEVATNLSKALSETRSVDEVKDVLLGKGKNVPTTANVVDQNLLPGGVPNEKAIKNLITSTVQDVKETVPAEAPKPSPAGTDDALTTEARKYKSANEFKNFMRGSATQYGDHNPALRAKYGLFEDSARLSDLGIDPEMEVTIYRGVPDTKAHQITDGDFVTTDRLSAESYAGRNNVVSKKVKARDLIADSAKDFDKNDPFYTGAEFVYSDSKNKLTNLTDKQLTDIYNKAVGNKGVSEIFQDSRLTSEEKNALQAVYEGSTDAKALEIVNNIKAEIKQDLFNKEPKLKEAIGEFKDGITPEEAQKKIREMFDEHEVEFIYGKDVGSLINEESKGLRGFHQPRRVVADLIALVEKNGKVSDATLYHEAFHAYLDNFVAPAEKARVIQYIIDNKMSNASMKVKYSDKTYPTVEEKAEEWLADDFANFVKTGEADAPLRNFFQRILDRIRKWIRGKANLEDLYERVLKKDRTTVNPKAKAKKPSLKVEDEKTPQEILAEAEAKAKQAGGQQDRIKGLAEIARDSEDYDEFVYKISNNKLLKQWRTDVQENGFNTFADFFKEQKRIQKGKAPTVPKPSMILAQEVLDLPEPPKSPEVPVERSTPMNKIALPEDLQRMQDEISLRKDSLENFSKGLDISGLEKYVIPSGEFAGQFPEVSGTDDASYLKEFKDRLNRKNLKPETRKRLQNYLDFAKGGDAIVTEYGFDDVREAEEAFTKYTEEKEKIKTLEREFRQARRNYLTDERDRIALNSIVSRQERLNVLRQVEDILRKEGRDRKAKIDAVKQYFNVDNKDIADVFKNKDYRLLSDKEFDQFMDELKNKAYEAQERLDALSDVKFTIQDKELLKVENLLTAMKLPKLENMTTEQLQSLDTLLQRFQRGDEFLGVRQLETLKNTDLADIHTKREALEDLVKRVQDNPKYAGITVDDLRKFSIKELDRFRYDSALARRHPFFEIMVHDANVAKIQSGLRYYELKKEFDALLKKARASRPRNFVEKIAPTDTPVFRWLEATPENKALIAKDMTAEELDLAKFMQEKYAAARDYLIQHETLKAYRQNYITHIRRGFLEAVLRNEPGRKTFFLNRLKNAFMEMFDMYKQDEAVFNILNQKTGQILPLEKFFQFSMKRSDNLIPTQNVGNAFLKYFETFEKKVALDALIPKIDIYAHSLAPVKETPRGLEYDPSIRNFVKEWLNSKKGRVTDAVFKAGGKMDWALRSLIALTRIRDLALNIPVGLASNFGAQMSTFTPLGFKKYAIGTGRMLSKQGKKIAEKYAPFVGESFVQRMTDLSKTIGDKFMEASFSLFSAADRRARTQYLLGSLTPQEFKSGEISVDRLADLKTEMGRYLPTEGDESIMGKTAIGKASTQYKAWAVQIIATTYDNVKQLLKMAKAKNFKGAAKSKEFGELLRGTLSALVLGLISYGAYEELNNKKERTFSQNLALKSMNDALSLIGALDPSLWTKTPRTVQFLGDLGNALTNVAISLSTGDRTDEGKVKGADLLKKTITPTIVKTVVPEKLTPEEESEKEVQKVYDQIQELKSEGRNEEAIALAEKSFPDTPEGKAGFEIYKKIRTRERTKATNDAVDQMKDTVKEIYDLKQSDNQEAIKEIVKDWDEEDLRIYQLAKKRYPPDGSKPIYEAGDEVSDHSVIDSIFTYAKAIGVDPVTAFNRIFTNQRIRRVDNGTVIISRNTTTFGKEGESGWSERVKQERGATKDQILDHTVPIQLGGADSRSNVELVPIALWQSYTPVENYLGKLLRGDKISKKEAQKFIRDFKKGLITFDEIKAQTQ